jgi:hypothetical protein
MWLRGLVATRQRPAALASLGLALSTLLVGNAIAANLTVQQGVVVKFGPDAGLTVRDGMTANQGAVFTSLKDDSVGGQTKPAAGSPASGDWRGIKVESSTAPNFLSLKSLSIRYAGGAGGAAFDVRRNNYSAFDLFVVTQSAVGIRATDGGTVRFTGLSLLGNQTGLQVNTAANVTVSASEIRGNTVFGATNSTPATVVQATGNYWGSASGPNDSVGNPTGQGDKVSTGVNYGSYLLALPLIDCSVAITNGRYTIANPVVGLSLACRNAIEYRLSESADFTSGAFQAIAATTTFTLSSTVGTKNIYAQFRGPSGNTLVVQLPQTITQNPPNLAVAITSPAPGAQLTGPTTISANATDPVAVTQVEFFVNNTRIAIDTAPPYSATWNTAGYADGNYVIKAVATNSVGATEEDSRTVNLRLLANDSTPPTIGDVRYNGVVLANGATISQLGTFSVAASDVSGLTAVALKIENVNIANTGNTAGGSPYLFAFNPDVVPNGNATITVTVTDRANNVSTRQIPVSISFPAPTAPTIATPVSNTTVRVPSLTVAGTSAAGSQVRIYVNGAAVGTPITVGANGSYSGSIPLSAEGALSLTAVASNSRGSSAASTAVPITYAISPPSVAFSSPAAGITVENAVAFQATVSDPVGIANVTFYIDGSQVASFSTPNGPYTYAWDAPNAVPGPHVLRVVATNTAGKVTESTRNVSSRPTPPPPPPPPYLGEITSFSPALSFGEQNITIVGRAKDRTTGASVPNVSLNVVLTVSGFKRQISVVTNATGQFTYSFAPQPADAGSYAISAVHPDDTSALVSMGTFSINRLTLSPQRVALTAARAIEQLLSLSVAASAGTGATGVRVEAIAADQPSGSLPAGVSIRNVSGTIALGSGQTGTVSVGITGSASAAETGTLVLALFAGESGNTKRGQVVIDYRLTTATPVIAASRTYIETGVAQGTQVTEVVAIENRGLVAATNVTLQLLDAANQPAPAWVYLSTAPNLGNIDVGQKPAVQLTASPPANLADGLYQFKLRVAAGNAVGGDIPFVVRVAPAGLGSVLFKASDIYTATLDRNGNRVPGLAGTKFRIQSERNSTITAEGVTNAVGELTLTNLQPGWYTYRASAKDHTDSSGRVLVRSGTLTEESSFLDNSLVTVEFSVTETTIQDRYEVRLVATFQTEVPAAVVVIEPGAINIPDMQVGESRTGEIAISNYGLVRADQVALTPPVSDEYFRVELLGQIPTEIAAKERVTIPYKITSLKALPGAALPTSAMVPLVEATGSAAQKSSLLGSVARKAGAACYNYVTTLEVGYVFECANGVIRKKKVVTPVTKQYGGCGGSGSGATVTQIGGAAATGIPQGPASGFGVSSPPTPLDPPRCTPRCASGECCVRK